MRVKPLSEVLGVELLDFDIKQPCSRQEQAELRRLFQTHHVLLVRGQNPTIEDHNRFGEYFGPLSGWVKDGDAGYVSNVIAMNFDEKKKGPTAVSTTEKLIWHADGTYGVHPGIATSLLALQVVPESGPTQFADCVRALEKLPPKLRARIEPMRAVHSLDRSGSSDGGGGKRFRDKTIPKEEWSERVRSYEHPLIYRPPHVDVELLFVNEFMTDHIVGLSRAESNALLDELFTYIYADDNVYTHRWQTNDVLIWDNIVLQHCRPDDMGTAPRHLRRLSLDGWYTDDGVIDWYATGTPRDLAALERLGAAYR